MRRGGVGSEVIFSNSFDVCLFLLVHLLHVLLPAAAAARRFIVCIHQSFTYSLSLSRTHTQAHTRSHTHAHARSLSLFLACYLVLSLIHTHSLTRTHLQVFSVNSYLISFLSLSLLFLLLPLSFFSI